MNEVIPAGEEPASQSSAVVVRSVFDAPTTEFRGALARRGENRQSLVQWIKSALVRGTDYGRIHTTSRAKCNAGGAPKCTYEDNPSHWSKDSLFKPGAEKICGMLGVTPSFPNLAEYERMAVEGIEIKSIILRCQIMAGDGVTVLGEGIGARTSDQDTELNKALKMAAKSAHIDATLRMAGLSEIFTQDLEDMQREKDARERERERNVHPRDGGHEPQHEPHNQRRGAPSTQRGKPETQAPQRRGNFATEKQIALIERRMGDAGIDARDLCSHFEIPALAEIPFGMVNDVLDFIANADVS